MKTAIDWIFKSSADPAKTSLAIRGALLLLVPQALQALSVACGFGLACFNIDAIWLNQFVEWITFFINLALTLVGGVIFLVGAGRKLVRTAKGTNETLNQ